MLRGNRATSITILSLEGLPLKTSTCESFPPPKMCFSYDILSRKESEERMVEAY